MEELRGIYKYFWETLEKSKFIDNYYYDKKEFMNYLLDPDHNAIGFVKKITSIHNKSAPTIAALSAMDLIEGSLGKLRTSHRKHLVHSINVLLLGLCFVERNSKLKQALLFFPGEKVNFNNKLNDNLNLRESVFHFRWIFCCFFHDIGYVFELLAKGLDPDNMGMEWEGVEEIRRGINRVKLRIQRELKSYIEELRELPIVPMITGYDDDKHISYYPERLGREIEEEKDVLRLYSSLINKVVPGKWGDKDQIFKTLCNTFNSSFQVGIENTYDHGKIGSFIFLHEIRTHYQIARLHISSSGVRNSWHRANIYYEILDASLAIYLHNTLRFQLNKGFCGKYSPHNVPPLAFLLTICDIIVEWDKEQIGYGNNDKSLDPEGINIIHDNDSQITIVYDSKKHADKVKSIIEDLFDDKLIKLVIIQKK
jgi:hypothetical protein